MPRHKEKKKKKKSKKAKYDTSSTESSDDDDASMWVEKEPQTLPSQPFCKDKESTKIKEDNELDEFACLPSVSLSAIKNKRQTERAEKKSTPLYEPSTHARELNPYWKEGGTGLPSLTPAKSSTVNDNAGLEWLMKGYKRCQELAEQEGRSFEEVVSERYGSLQELESLIAAKKAKLGYNESKSFSSQREKEKTKRNVPYQSKSSRNYSEESDSDDSKSKKTKKHIHRKRSRSHSRERISENRLDKWKDSGARWSDYRNKSSSFGAFRRPDRDEDLNIEKKDENFSKKHSSESADSTYEYKGLGELNSSTKASWRKKDANKPKHDTLEQSIVQVETKRDRDYSKDSEPVSVRIEVEKRNKQVQENLQKEEKIVVMRPLTKLEKNELGAKIVRAELMGNEELAKQLKKKLESGEIEVSEKNDNVTEKVVVLMRTDASGLERPVWSKASADSDDLMSLVRQERMTSAADQNAMFVQLTAKSAVKHEDDEGPSDSKIMDTAEKTTQKYIDREKQIAAIESKKIAKFVDKCAYCFEKTAKHLVVAVGNKVYLSLPPHQSMAEGHCLIVPMNHVTQSTVTDEDVWAEIQEFRHALTRMFADRDEDCIFMETAIHLKHHPHMHIECVPMPTETGDLAPIYFKKAIQESGSEWADNKKCVDISKKSIRHAIPKGFPYFAVDFGMQGGFAHVVEDENVFPSYFGREIVGGMLDMSPSLWRKPKQDTFDEQCKKVLQFSSMWKTYDWTNKEAKT